MSKFHPTKIAGHTVERVTVGKHELGQIEITPDVTVLFRMADDGGGGGGGGGIDVDCLVCKISKIRECADEVCPEIKAGDPNASCADAIADCAAAKCKAECTGSGSSFSGGILIMA